MPMTQVARSTDEHDYWPGADPEGASGKVYRGIMKDLEDRRLVPGQRLVETELAARFSVGRNAVREAMQRLAVRGVVDLSRNRSASIRLLDTAETMEVLDVAAAMTALVAGAAARRYDARLHGSIMNDAIKALAAVDPLAEPHAFSLARRNFYRALLAIGGNRELQRLFPAIGMHIIHSQFQSPKLQSIRVADYHSIRDAVVAHAPESAEAAGKRHVENVRAVILELAASNG